MLVTSLAWVLLDVFLLTYLTDCGPRPSSTDLSSEHVHEPESAPHVTRGPGAAPETRGKPAPRAAKDVKPGPKPGLFERFLGRVHLDILF